MGRVRGTREAAYARPPMPLDRASLTDLVARALAEDLGDGDVTTQATVPEGLRAVATRTQKAPGVVFGLEVAEAVLRQADPGVELERLLDEGVWHEPPAHVLRASGSAAGL